MSNKLNLRTARRIKTADGEVLRLKGQGFSWETWTPARLFRNGEQGAWFDPSDLSTLFQDSEGTIPVTGPGQPVGLMLDKSGNGNHAAQTTTTARPELRFDSGEVAYLYPDGVDDGLYFGPFLPFAEGGLFGYANEYEGGSTRILVGSLNVAGAYTGQVSGRHRLMALDTGIASLTRAAVVGYANSSAEGFVSSTGVEALGAWSSPIAEYGRLFQSAGSGAFYGMLFRSGSASKAEATDYRTWLAQRAGIE